MKFKHQTGIMRMCMMPLKSFLLLYRPAVDALSFFSSFASCTCLASPSMHTSLCGFNLALPCRLRAPRNSFIYSNKALHRSLLGDVGGRRLICTCVATSSGTKQAYRSEVRQPRSLYEILGITASASTSEVRAAYRSLAALHHPDVSTSAAAATNFKVIALACAALSDPLLRRRYDDYGIGSLGPRFQALKDALGAVVGGRLPGLAMGQKGKDVHTTVGLLLREAATGTGKTVHAWALDTCSMCQGYGQVEPSESCLVCHGPGEVMRSRRLMDSGLRTTSMGTCPACSGKGVSSAVPCTGCSGEGQRRVRRSVAVQVPAGVNKRSVMRLLGLGDEGRFGGSSGDLLLHFSVHAEAEWSQVGDDLHSLLNVSLLDALLGTTASVATLLGVRSLPVPPGTQHGDVLRVDHGGLTISPKPLVKASTAAAAAAATAAAAAAGAAADLSHLPSSPPDVRSAAGATGEPADQGPEGAAHCDSGAPPSSASAAPAAEARATVVARAMGVARGDGPVPTPMAATAAASTLPLPGSTTDSLQGRTLERNSGVGDPAAMARGHHYFKVAIIVPDMSALGDRAHTLLQQLSEL